MTRDDFVRIRARQGKIARVRDPQPCERCGDSIQLVLTRIEPRPMHFVFDAGRSGKLHSCSKLALLVGEGEQ
jgi:hypothetical protein